MDDSSDIAKAQCERTAKEYIAFRKKGNTANDLVEIPAMRGLIGDVAGKKVIDCGCGFGSYAIWCAQQGAAVTGIDISEIMIHQAKREAERAGVKVDLLIGDVTNMPEISDCEFDIAISSNTVCFDIPRFFREVARVLKPGGRFCLCEVHPLMNLQFGDYFDRTVRKAKNVFGKLEATDADYEWQWEHLTLSDLFMALRDMGFVIDSIMEPQPRPSTRATNPEFYDRASKSPVFILIEAIKQAQQASTPTASDDVP